MFSRYFYKNICEISRIKPSYKFSNSNHSLKRLYNQTENMFQKYPESNKLAKLAHPSQLLEESSSLLMNDPILESNPALFRRISFLGTSSAVPCPGRCNVSSLLVSLSTGSSIMVDCGEATQHQLMRSKSIKMSKIEVVLITHLHGDHFFGIFGMLATLGTHGRTQPVTVVGPKGLKNAIESVFLAGETEGEAVYPMKIIELETSSPTFLPSPSSTTEETPFTLASDPGVDIVAVPIEHRVPCVGYVLRERSKIGALDAKKARELGASNPQMRDLKNGIDVVGKSGETIRALDVVGPTIKGRKICVLQDTHDPSKYSHLLQNCDVMIHEATYDDSMREKSIEHGHSTARMAAQFAVETNASNLILTHFSSRYDKEMLVKDENRVLFNPPKSYTLRTQHEENLKNGTEVSPEITQRILDTLSVFDLKREAEDTVIEYNEAQNTDKEMPVFIAADFRNFDSDKYGKWSQVEEADVDLTKMF